ncbi:hypothetical protein GGS20DRAFT_506570 [Poronia punctata]|nr:hypothetical protein GGS20DRAFT_506570 [Poronia punctata]
MSLACKLNIQSLLFLLHDVFQLHYPNINQSLFHSHHCPDTIAIILIHSRLCIKGLEKLQQVIVKAALLVAGIIKIVDGFTKVYTAALQRAGCTLQHE